MFQDEFICMTKKKVNVPGSKLCSGPFKFVVAVPVTGHSRHEDVELRVWGADDDHLWGHVTKYHLREELHISRSEVLNAAHTDR